MAEANVEQSEPNFEEGEPVVATNDENAIPEPITPVVETPDPKKRGRPAGAKDKAPRKKKLTIVEEPIVSEPAPEVVQPKPKAQPKPKQQELPVSTVTFEEPVVEEPPSPRTIMRDASRTLMQLKHLSDTARKTHLGELYTQKLHRL